MEPTYMESAIATSIVIFNSSCNDRKLRVFLSLSNNGDPNSAPEAPLLFPQTVSKAFTQPGVNRLPPLWPPKSLAEAHLDI